MSDHDETRGEMAGEDERETLAGVVCAADDSVDMRYGLHMADAVLAAGYRRTPQAGEQGTAVRALREAADAIVRGAGLIPPPRGGGQHPAVEWLRSRADALASKVTQ